eukprot:CAMPEP_0173394726 /NCGR_PEP_ID=MMETSP1356-20130122/29074_1 /TAXON_ID=77927 ORGANISM="Hemiselmis virescens, Strain PCC157" /NCGR_SAMPLE_ID=MMETSP1356 /ASSEMBLY_ACC=CAM_ASM_000847 /LENGTH=83 /DNA_ID=CAMNT_0014353201 /DNA_START=224 /DNA_END=472 /DNA_ORIENTATION=-
MNGQHAVMHERPLHGGAASDPPVGAGGAMLTGGSPLASRVQVSRDYRHFTTVTAEEIGHAGSPRSRSMEGSFNTVMNRMNDVT